ncbi:hypothetical protein ROA7450_01471 [Roseovarius albus]|uniref:Porin domain-containing protein n=1 Tax=Roseovarius albus TaxID=1247867 RepID=A0A1X6YVT2_9RHOB|nr:hypothetical protein [Roseovarius albus]SLN32393.1 hypothetical protein ROA7450_01471 [Roseovarius albus]
MKIRPLFPLALAGISGWITYPLVAQEARPISATLDLSQRFESGDNLALESPSEGTTNLSTTSLTFNLNSATETQALDFSVGGLLRLGDLPENSDASTGFGEPHVRLGYDRNTGNAALSFDTFYRQNEVGFLRPLDDFTDADGNINLPPDFNDLNGTGTRDRYGFDTSLEIGQNAPLGFIFDASADALEYNDVSAGSDLNDNWRAAAGITTLFRASETTTGRLELDYSRFEEENDEDTKRDRYSALAGVTYELDQITTLDFGLGYEEIVTHETTGTETEAGPIGRIGYARIMPNGTADVSLESTRDQSGQRYTFEAGRSLNLALGQELSTSLGVTTLDGEDPNIIGGIEFLRELDSSRLRFSANRQVLTDSDDEERLTNRVGLGYDYDINSISGLGINFGYSLAEGNAFSNEVERTSTEISYRRSLTEEWSLRSGVLYEYRAEENDDDADSTSIFVTLDRTFDLLN